LVDREKGWRGRKGENDLGKEDEDGELAVARLLEVDDVAQHHPGQEHAEEHVWDIQT